ncbi:MAG: tail fiber protein [Archangium sp.]|nr:tail fiber protein [Archangium sp.]
MSWEKYFVRLQVAVVLIVALTAMVWGPREVLQSVLGTGQPLAGELVPRQIPYRGFLEQNGVAVNDPAVPMRFRIFGIDGGILHEESRGAVPVQGGQFSVELGDTTPIPRSVSEQNFLELEVAVGTTPIVLASRQRILTVPFSARALDSWRADTAATASGLLATQVVPPGTVVPFAGTTPPQGWLACDGASISRAIYPALFAAIGTSHGTADSQSFNVPDLRGRFVRGVDDPACTRDVDCAARSAAAPGGNTGNDVGTVQNDELRSHIHMQQYFSASNSGGQPSFTIALWNGGNGPNNTRDPVSPTGGSETRPLNVSMNWIIKF